MSVAVVDIRTDHGWAVMRGRPEDSEAEALASALQRPWVLEARVPVTDRYGSCAGCGGSLVGRRYCGSACRQLAYRRRRGVTDRYAVEPVTDRYAVCAQCGTDFEPRRRDARYCSATCRQRARRARAA